MKKWSLFAIVVFPIVLLTGIASSQSKNAPRPRLIANNPDGTATLDWSRDRRFVRVDPMDKRRELQWGTTYFDTKTGRRVTLDSAKMQRKFGKSPFYLAFDARINRTALTICSQATGACLPLQNQPRELHRSLLDFGNQRFYQPTRDGQEITAVNRGEVLYWSTRTGALIRRVRFLSTKDSDANFPPVLSPDAKFVVAQGAGRTALYEARTGQLCYVLTPSGDATDYGFSPSGRVLYVSFFDNEGHELHVFKSLNIGRTLWSFRASTYARVAFSPRDNLVAFADSRGLELRDVSTGKLKQRLSGPTGAINLAFSPDGKTIWTSQQINNQGFSPILSWRVH